MTRARLEAAERAVAGALRHLRRRVAAAVHDEPESAFRTAFQKDRDRVIHTSAFRRLEYKTQVLRELRRRLLPHRLTHTLEVAQVARSIARALGLNEDLAETVALAHDLGHPPFGHAGERTLDRSRPTIGGFDHNKQSLRIVTELERPLPRLPWPQPDLGDARGDHEARDRVRRPRRELGAGRPAGLEAQVVNAADEIAYNAHDLDDGLRSGHLDVRDVAEVPLVARLLEALGIDPQRFGTRDRYVLQRELLGLVIEDVVGHSEGRLRAAGVSSTEDVRRAEGSLLGPSPELAAELAELKRFLYERFYFHYRLIRMTRKADHILERLYRAYLAGPAMLPPEVRSQAEALGLEPRRGRLPVGDDRPLRGRRVPAAVRPQRAHLTWPRLAAATLSSVGAAGHRVEPPVARVAEPRGVDAAAQDPHQDPGAGERLRDDRARRRLRDHGRRTGRRLRSSPRARPARSRRSGACRGTRPAPSRARSRPAAPAARRDWPRAAWFHTVRRSASSRSKR
jgi:dGTPase